MLDAAHTKTPDAVAATPAETETLQKLRQLLARVQGELKFQQTRNEALNFEIARLKRWRFGSSSESLDTSTQAVLFDSLLIDTALEDRAADEANKSPASPPRAKGQAVRQALPASLPRVEHRHEIAQTHCACGQAFKRIGEEVSEQLDCVPAQFFVLRHIRGKYACACCQTIAAAPMPAQMIDKGIPAPGLLAQVAVAKHDDHLPLYRQEEIYASKRPANPSTANTPKALCRGIIRVGSGAGGSRRHGNGGGLPVVRQQQLKVSVLERGQPLEHVLQIRPRIVPIELGRLHQAHDDRRALAG